MDLFDRGDERFHVTLDVLDLVRSGAEVTGVVSYDQAFARKPEPGEAPVPLQHLFSKQEVYRRSVDRQLRGYKQANRRLLWTSLEKEPSQGFGGVHLALPAPEPDRPDVFARGSRWPW